jgi:kinesin family protein 15
MADGLAHEDFEYPQVPNSNTTFKGTFFEIFNERVYDLLSSDSLEKSLAVREDRNGVYVEGLTEIEVKNTKDAEDLLTKGLANRHVASTNMNRTSSRSHAIFVLSVKTEQTTSDGLRKVRHSKFTLVDLAGSERQKSTGKL